MKEETMPSRKQKNSWLGRYVRKWYSLWIRPHITKDINQQRIKLLWFIWGYWPILFDKSLAFSSRIGLVAKFLRVDWNVPHGHHPCEIANICLALTERPANTGEIMVEAGCWQGGSSAKFSIICKMMDYKLYIYDSFEGVEELSAEAKQKSFDYSGKYKATELILRENLKKYGELEICSIHKGWFAETLALNPLHEPIRGAYIDCDIAKGTLEVLQGTIPGLVGDGWIFSQDFQIKPVQDLVYDPGTWKKLGKDAPKVTRLCGNLAILKF